MNMCIYPCNNNKDQIMNVEDMERFEQKWSSSDVNTELMYEIPKK